MHPPVISATETALLSNSQQTATRWEIDTDGGISWTVADKPHQDMIEMSGRKVSVIVRYGTNTDGTLQLNRHIVWPMLRTIPNNTHASLSQDFNAEVFPQIKIDSKLITAEQPQTFRHRGLMTIHSVLDSDMHLIRTLFPSLGHPAILENCTLINRSTRTRNIEIDSLNEVWRTDPTQGVDGEYIMEARGFGDGVFTLQPGEAVEFGMLFSGRRAYDEPLQLDPTIEQKAREGYVEDLFGKLHFECPDSVLVREFAFCKIRAAESIFETKNGLMHAPGGGPYYAAIWANDQAEYANPFFPFLGNPSGDESAMNSFRLFARFINPEFVPIPSSIIAEGTDIWNGAGDRGDAAMIAYGASRYALACGDRKTAEALWPLIEWCLEYCRRNTNVHGVITSDADELERRFPAGDANLCTSSLNYDALNSAAILAVELGKPDHLVDQLNARARQLHQAIERHFGATIGGFDTYRYYDGNTTLRAWICIPLTVGILDRKDATIDAIFSTQLWSEDGLLTESGKDTFWDRSTLYALRGIFNAGEGERALEYLKYYSRRRLLGDHVPYPVEEGPSGDQRHLSAESALYCRVITEGLFGIQPKGLRKFEITPYLPKEWNEMALRNVHGFGNIFDIEVAREEETVILKVRSERGEAVIHSAPNNVSTFIVNLPE